MAVTHVHTRAVDETGRLVAIGLASIALAGMAYCHIADVGMKFEEHVYYMAALFIVDIVLSIALIPAVVLTELRGSPRARQLIWAATGALAGATILGFLWSRTIGFPQMADHIGSWDALGLTSLVFEGVLVVLSVVMLTQIARRRT